MTNKDLILRIERQSLMIGTMLGQISEILNNIKRKQMTVDAIYSGLYDIHMAAGLQAHELFYKKKNNNEESE